MSPNRNVFHLPNLGENLTDEDRAAFHFIGLPLPQFAHGPRDCTADYYADEDRRDAQGVLHSFKMKALDRELTDLTPQYRFHTATSAGLSHAERVMRQILLAQCWQCDLDAITIY